MKLFTLVAIGLLLPSLAYAQSTSPFGNRGEIDLNNTYHPPRVFIPKAEVTFDAKTQTVTGVFNAFNSEKSTVADLGYRVELMSLPEGTEEAIQESSVILYDVQVFPENITLAPQETKAVPVTYKLPGLPNGAYRMRLMMTSLRGRDLGWYDATITVTGSAVADVIELGPGPFDIPEYQDTVLEPLSGPNVSAGSSFEIQAEATSEQGITVTPVLDIYEFDQARGRLNQVIGRPQTLRAGQPTRFKMPVVAADQPEVYFGVLWLRGSSGRQVSSLATYRWVVRGADADVLWTRIDRMGSKANDKAIVAVDFVGAADAETTFDADVVVSLGDDHGVLASHTEQGLKLADSIRQGTFIFPLPRDIVGTPRVSVRIASPEKEYFAREVRYNLAPQQIDELASDARVAEGRLKIGLVLIIVGAAAFGYSLWRSRKKRRS
ncbi:MAG: hypothetical protein HYR90_04450 [Candidatus Andersenbacteria bacterium]|nr:hypothetical protein [Candidatus Andersenbacteria bacterium]MBI3250477.1 hypothetical protein [Candidatus Andersenbacteria bacterium]